ncbi:MAG: glycine cleavage system aminomethyltransferase GcvT [Acholeplasmataceae bacterium]
MKKTPLHDRHLALGARMTEFAGFEMPLSYTSIPSEHRAVRTHVGVFDVSHMGEILIKGDDALGFVNYLVTNRIDREKNRVTYALLCDDNGYPLDDLLVYVIDRDRILLVVNASNTDKDFDFILSHSEPFAVTVKNRSKRYGQLAVQGPKAYETLSDLLDEDLSSITFMTFRKIDHDGKPLIVSRTGYTGEDGFELYGDHEEVRALWDALIDRGVVPCGLGARDTLRFEANLPLYGNEMSDSIDPYEAGLGFAIELEKSFVGRDALVAHKENRKRRIVGIELLERGIPRHGYPVFSGDDRIGFVTTGYLLPDRDRALALALIDTSYARKGSEVTVEIRNKRVKARIRNRRFYQKKYQKQEA